MLRLVAEMLINSILKLFNFVEADPQNDKSYLDNLEEDIAILAEE